MINTMQFTPYGQAPMMRDEAPRALAERLTYLAGIRAATVRDTLRHIFSLATQLRLDFYVLQTSNAELAKVMDVTSRTVQNRLKEVSELGLSHLKISHDDYGQIIEFDLSSYYGGGEVGGEVPHEIGGEIKNKGGVKYPTKYPTKSETGTDVATCTGVTIPPSLTEKEEKEHGCEGVHVRSVAPAAGSSLDELTQLLISDVRRSRIVTPQPSDFEIEKMVIKVMGHTEDQAERKAFISDTITRLATRKRDGKKVGHASLYQAMTTHKDFGEWKLKETQKATARSRGGQHGPQSTADLMAGLERDLAQQPEPPTPETKVLTAADLKELIELSESSFMADSEYEQSRRERLRAQLAELVEVAA